MSEALDQQPTPVTEAWLAEQPAAVQFQYCHRQHYLPDAPELWLTVWLHQDEDSLLVAIKESNHPQSTGRLSSFKKRAEFEAFVRQQNLSTVDLRAPLQLETVAIPKPWGQEIWYTGIEERGVCSVAGMPLSWLVDVFGPILGCNGSPLLLKILDPHPAENLGDLYFEMHEEKIEVYVVTHIDETAWPGGVGAIRYGFDPEQVKAVGREQFLSNYVAAVEHYQIIRNQIDETLLKRSNGKLPAEPVQLKALLEELPVEMIAEEQRRRDVMNRFTQLQPLNIGDVVTVEKRVPHSLQHGVRVVEFQTPHYERYILSFGQKVLTQDHWDTHEALTRAVTEAQQIPEPEAVADGVDLITNFDAFHVLRLRLSDDVARLLDGKGYQIVMGVEGACTIKSGIAETEIGTEQAVYCGPSRAGWTIEGASGSMVLVAREGPFNSED